MSPVLVASEAGPWPLHDAASSRSAEAVALAATPPQALMQLAGLAVARLALALVPHARAIEVIAGPGNNGGDGLEAAMHLHKAGMKVGVRLLADPARLPADAATALRRASKAGVDVAARAANDAADLYIDGMLGLGARRAPEGAIAAAIESLNAQGRPVLAIDLPSGLHPDTGQPLGSAAVRASATLSLLTLKPGLYTGAGRDHAGQVWFDGLGVSAAGPTALLNGPPDPVKRAHALHKGSFGDVGIVGGAPGMTGAAWLAARAALAAGAGRVYCSLLDPQASLLDTLRPELMGRTQWWTSMPAVLAASTVVCGCGGGTAIREALPPLLAHAAGLVLDADALNAVAADSALRLLLRARGERGRPTVLTPHPLEAARLLGVDAAAVQSDRLLHASRLAHELGATVVLKGSGSIIAEPPGPPLINPTGNALLATAGTGDVLAGWIGGLWAQGGSARQAAAAAVWRHGHAADLAAASTVYASLRAADLIEAMRASTPPSLAD